MPESHHAYRFRPGTDLLSAPLVLLHGSDGDESELLPLAAELAPHAATLAVRGAVATQDGYAFFRRFPDRRVDEADVAARTPALAAFIDTFCARHTFPTRPVAIGFSNGAIIAAALLQAHPGSLAAAILFRPLSPFSHDLSVQLHNTPVLIIDGAKDHRRAPGDGLRLAERLIRVGASVTHHVLPVGHAITADDKRLARAWLQAVG